MMASTHILVHDYCGHPSTIEFARELARRGWRITYAYFADDGGPKGVNSKTADDPETLDIRAVEIDMPYSKSNFIRRRQGDIAYGKAIGQLVVDLAPDIVLSGNTPTETQESLVAGCRQVGARFIYWCQDFYSIAASLILSRKLPGIGGLIGRYYKFLERRQMVRADHVIHITDRFLAQTDAWGIPRDKVSVIPNWGVVDKIDDGPRDNAWSERQGLTRPHRVIYSGTLALKHNPELLSGLARQLGDKADVVVVGFGVGADALRETQNSLPNLTVLPLQDFEDFPLVLNSADVLVAVIEVDAGEFSVPSKVLSYLCSGRPIVLAAPAENLAAEIVETTSAGRVVAPEDTAGFAAAVEQYLAHPEQCRDAGLAGRAYAQAHFDLTAVSEKFEALFTRLSPPLSDPPPTPRPAETHS